MRPVAELIAAQDVPGLLAHVDARCAGRDWDGLVALAASCDEATERGIQLWAVSQYCAYRLALEAPPRWAGRTLAPGAARFALGPLTEVVGHRFAWADIAEHIGDEVSAAVVAAECALRGEDLRGEAVASLADLPLALFGFEPDYPLPDYRAKEAHFPAPRLPGPDVAEEVGPQPEAHAESDEAAEALASVADGWAVGEGPGRVRAVRSPNGTVEGALAALSPRTPVSRARLAPADAMAWLAWAGASGARWGRRRGGAAGRFAAWWAVAAVAGLEWPDGPAPGATLVDDLAAATDGLVWWRWWRADDPEAGWVVRLAVADPVDGEAWALEAVQPPEDDV